MKEEELRLILEEGEGLKIDFKESFDSKGLGKDLVAFTNAVGGRIFLGIDDHMKVKGIEITNKLKSEIQDLARNCEPQIKINLQKVVFNQKSILTIEVAEGNNKPYLCSNGFYLRQGANSQKLSSDEILHLVVGLGKVRFDEQYTLKFIFTRDFDLSKFTDFLKRTGITQIGSVQSVLQNLSLGMMNKKKFILNNTGVLFFSKDPYKFYHQNIITCVLYKGKERVEVLDRKNFSDDLLKNYEDTVSFLRQHLRVQYSIENTGPRKETLELPESALRETVLNAIVHRDYFDERFGIFVEIFDDRVEITNKGKLLFEKSKLGTLSLARNLLIFDIFYRLRLIEKIGSGINRIKKVMKQAGLIVEFDVDDFFKVVFRRGNFEPLSEPLKPVVQYIEKNKSSTQGDIMQALHLSRATATRYISKLQKKGLIRRLGSKKTGYYARKCRRV